MLFLLHKIKNVAAYLIIALAVYGAYTVYQHWFKRTAAETYESYALGVAEDSSLITGYAYVGVLWFLGEGESASGPSKGSFHVEDWYLAPPQGLPEPKFRVDASKLQGVCYRLYRVAFGFPVLKTALDAYAKGKTADAEAVASRILAVETIETRAAKDFTEYACDQFDADVAGRTAAIERRLVLDYQLQAQLASGCLILAAYAGAGTDGAALAACRGRIDEWRMAVSSKVACHIENALADTPNAQCQPTGLLAQRTPALRAAAAPSLFESNFGYLASLKVTLSTVGIITNQTGWWFIKFEQFYVRRDLTEALYGSEIRDVQVREDSGAPTLNVVAGKPDLVSRNRVMTIAVKSGSFRLSDKVRETQDRRGYVEAKMLESIDGALEEIGTPARRLAAQYLRAHLEQLAQAKRATLALKLE